jgi:hypothetical protein
MDSGVSAEERPPAPPTVDGIARHQDRHVDEAGLFQKRRMGETPF